MKLIYLVILISFNAIIYGNTLNQDQWIISTQSQWIKNTIDNENIQFKNGFAKPLTNEVVLSSVVKKFPQKRKLESLTIEQSHNWMNWKEIPNVGPKNAKDAPVALAIEDKNYWMFARYAGGAIDKAKVESLKIEESVYMRRISRMEADRKIADINSNISTIKGEKGGGFAASDNFQTNGSGGENLGLGGYHAWHSKDMIHWVHHGPVSNYKSRWMTTAEYKDGDFYLYYDNPNDQDPHLIIDGNLTDGKIGNDLGLVFADPSNGSDNTVIRGADGKFHFIYEDWSPLNARNQAWDSPLAGHAISDDGINDWKILPPAIDLRSEPTGKVLKYRHPHQYPPMLEYNEHLPKQDAFGDWAAIMVGDRYYLFADYDPASNDKKSKGMSVAWFTSDNLNEKFTFCGHIGHGHPDPDIIFAEGKFYLITQFDKDFVSPGPWVDGVQARIGVDTNNDGKINQWTPWQEIKESYNHKPGFAKQIVKIPASFQSETYPSGYAFQFELKMTIQDKSKIAPIINSVKTVFQ